MTGRPLIAGNWKMNKTPEETEAFIRAFMEAYRPEAATEVVLIPPFTGLDRAGRLLSGSGVGLGAQDLHVEPQGAYTGEVSGGMLRACGCSCVLVGHSERRRILGEDDQLVAAKLRAARSSGLRPILCVGETLDEHRAGRTDERVAAQLDADLPSATADDVSAIVVAYEPIWAIGTGETATPEEAQTTIHRIRAWFAERYDAGTAAGLRILYGGSVKPENAAELLQQPDIDGALVGGASLDPDAFARIAAAARGPLSA